MAVTVYDCDTFSVSPLCQEVRPVEYVPVTGSPEVGTVTFLSVPPAALTVIPVAGSAVLSPPPGVIVTAGPAGGGLAFGDAEPPADEPGLLPPYFTPVV